MPGALIVVESPEPVAASRDRAQIGAQAVFAAQAIIVVGGYWHRFVSQTVVFFFGGASQAVPRRPALPLISARRLPRGEIPSRAKRTARDQGPGERPKGKATRAPKRGGRNRPRAAPGLNSAPPPHRMPSPRGPPRRPNRLSPGDGGERRASPPAPKKGEPASAGANACAEPKHGENKNKNETENGKSGKNKTAIGA